MSERNTMTLASHYMAFASGICVGGLINSYGHGTTWVLFVVMLPVPFLAEYHRRHSR